jgi:DNA polymerase III delta prime subunit
MYDMELPWDIKHQTSSLSKFVFQTDEDVDFFSNLTHIPNLFLCGTPGTGKTTLAEILINKFNIDPYDVKTINASVENGVDTIRDIITTFSSTSAMGDYKVIFLDEADYLSANAQAALRVPMNEYADSVKFIIACNYENKIIQAIKSRCDRQIRFQTPSKDALSDHVSMILLKENITFNLDDVDYYVDQLYPDMRMIIKAVEQNIKTGTLKVSKVQTFDVISFVESGNWSGLRTYIEANRDTIEVESVFVLLYENLQSSPKFKNESNYENGIVTIANWMSKQGANDFIYLLACVIELSMI